MSLEKHVEITVLFFYHGINHFCLDYLGNFFVIYLEKAALACAVDCLFQTCKMQVGRNTKQRAVTADFLGFLCNYNVVGR